MTLDNSNLSDEVIIQECIDYVNQGMTIPLHLKLWLDEKGLLYQIENPPCKHKQYQ